MLTLLGRLKKIKSAKEQAELTAVEKKLLELRLLADTIFTKHLENIDKKYPTNLVTNYEISKLYKMISHVKQQNQNLLLNNTSRLQKSIIAQNQRLQVLLKRFTGLSLLAFLAAITASLIITKSISRPIKRLKHSTDAFANGKQDVHVTVQSNDELADLAHSFNHMTQTLIFQKDQLSRSKKMETLGLLAGEVAHDLNNVLTGIVSYPELLLMDMDNNDPRYETVQVIKNSGEKAAAIVQDLLTFARRGVSVNEVLNLNDIVREYLNSPECAKLIEHHPSVRLEKVLDQNLKNIVGSPVHLKKAIANLVLNAVEAQPEGGLVTVITQIRFLDKPLNRYSSVEEGPYVVLIVEDQGLGIKPEDLDRIFEPFYTKKTMDRSGTGLGMPIVWGTVEDHHGYIQVNSTAGKGTTIESYFPITKDQLPDKIKKIPLKKLLGNNQQILVVDDMESQRILAESMLVKLNYSVHTVASGESAIDYLKTTSVDLVVLDMIMGEGMDGYETYKRIVQLHPGQKAIIASGFAETKRVEKAMALGVGQFLKKPYRFEEIGLAVKNELAI